MPPEQPHPEENGEQAQFIEPNSHSFILKVWLIDSDKTQDKQNWRGYLTHVVSGQRRYFDNLSEMNNLLIPYLKGMGTKLPYWWRAYRWLTQ
ncbi:hypothetical protein MNBD_CHLOROFLEXI01-4935 [hydrothermal vent metagenome]|uniref:Uncharacterized protein n=1 Tax=hydrothermal vent metagenome TaxID=652676 RepID=A0A3B0UZ49_9ZZZZ